MYLNQPLDRVKHCNVSIFYGVNCNQLLGTFTSVGTGDSLKTPDLLLQTANGTELCYSVNASSGGRTVIVEGILNVITINSGKCLYMEIFGEVINKINVKCRIN